MPRLLEEQVVGDGVDIESLQGRAHPGAVGHRQRLCEASGKLVKRGHEVRVAAEVGQIAPDERRAEETLRRPIQLGFFAHVVQQHHAALGHRADHGRKPRQRPLLVGKKRPRHLIPDRLRIGLGHSLVDRPGHAGQIIGIPTRGRNLVERIGSVEMVGTEKLALRLEKTHLHILEQRIGGVEEPGGISGVHSAPTGPDVRDPGFRLERLERLGNVARERREDRLDAELPCPGEDLLLELPLSVDVRHGQRPTPLVEIRHAVPGQVGGRREVGSNLFRWQTVGGPYAKPYRLLTALQQAGG